MNSSTADAATGSSTSETGGLSGSGSNRAAAVIYDDVIEMAAGATKASGTAGWTYEDGSAWDPAAPDIVFNPSPCPGPSGSSEQLFMQFELLGPAPADPLAARKQMQAYLEEQGFRITRSIDPPESSNPKRTFIVSAESPDGAMIDYGANSSEQLLGLRSECSDHPSLTGEVGPETP
ncbi:hypothetical protein LOC59_08540 [Arthrobacter sp. zg-Y916]|uniref:Uncharacterized protein n=1 Tax=Arthrobacter caoxuetaonis TaxID=2886935 RepID=A0A9X1SCI9_9MICC|nr:MULTISPECIES: hypothetical protein [Arthrobacter]MCC3297761.1 hypothetical protein [Arthrobacter caoxuetaonis]MCC9193697.1 hypothetical protein [Arthrobacter sp. zg-Y916]USQ56044.1 hypothetical protein NF551_09655 [Arthrobacter caoxuetaonis]